MKQAENIYQVLREYIPGDSIYLRNNYKAFERELDNLDKYISEKLAPFEGSKLLVFHPAFGYFTDAYGLVQVPIELAGKEPGARYLNQVIELARRENIKAIFVQQQFSTETAEVVAEAVGAEVVVLDPLAEDYISNMKQIADKVAKALAVNKN
jgi:zinc transport system substrate-binding protein